MPAVLDRTLEFHQIVASRRGTQQPPATARPPIRRSEFATAASAIGADIHRTMSKLSKLTQLAQSRSLFDDPMAEINELTHIVKQDITALNSTLAKLQGALAGANSAAAGKQRTAHSTSVVDALKAQLLEATRDFQETLQQRSHNMQLMQKRREEFSAPVDLFSPPDPKGSSSAPGSASAASGAPMPADSGGGFGGESTQLRKRFAPPAPIFELCAPPTPDEGGGGAGGSFAAGGFGGFGGGGSGGFGGGGRHALYKKTDDPPVSAAWASPAAKPAGMTSGADGAVVIDMTSIGAMQQQQMAYAPMGGAYLDARAQAVDTVQSTIAEVGGMFQQLAEMVQQQGWQLQRVDENIEDSLSNVQEGLGQLQRFYRNMSSNRGLMVRIFAILLFFVVVWGTLFA